MVVTVMVVEERLVFLGFLGLFRGDRPSRVFCQQIFQLFFDPLAEAFSRQHLLLNVLAGKHPLQHFQWDGGRGRGSPRRRRWTAARHFRFLHEVIGSEGLGGLELSGGRHVLGFSLLELPHHARRLPNPLRGVRRSVLIIWNRYVTFSQSFIPVL